MELAKYLGQGGILLSPRAGNKEGLLAELVAAACAGESSWDAAAVLQKVREREAARSTGFGKGLAVAHARVENCPHLKVVVARPSAPIDWDAADGQPVQFVLLVIGSHAQDALYLQILSEIIKIWAREATRALLLSAQSSEELARVIAETRVRSHPR